jgi:hypothetical protein
MTRAEGLRRLTVMKKRAVICAVVVALLVLAALGLVLRSG